MSEISDSIFDIVHIERGEMAVKTKGLYRVLYHAEDGSICDTDELLKAKEAIRYAQYENRYLAEGRSKGWAEVISYADFEKRQEYMQEQEYREMYHQGKLQEIAAAEKPEPKPGIVRRGLTRAAAMIW